MSSKEKCDASMICMWDIFAKFSTLLEDGQTKGANTPSEPNIAKEFGFSIWTYLNLSWRKWRISPPPSGGCCRPLFDSFGCAQVFVLSTGADPTSMPCTRYFTLVFVSSKKREVVHAANRLSFKAILFLGVFETLDSVGHLEKSSGFFLVWNWPCWTLRLMRFAQEVDMVPRLPRLNTFQLEGQFCVLRCAVLHGFSWVTTYGMLILLQNNCDFYCSLFLLLDSWVWWMFQDAPPLSALGFDRLRNIWGFHHGRHFTGTRARTKGRCHDGIAWVWFWCVEHGQYSMASETRSWIRSTVHWATAVRDHMPTIPFACMVL